MRYDTSAGSLFFLKDMLVFEFEYNADIVDEVRRIPGAKYDSKFKVWRVPAVQIDASRRIAQRHNFFIEPTVARFDVPRTENEFIGLKRDGEWVYLGFLYDQVKVRKVKQLPGVTWHSKSKAWRVPVTAIAEAVAWADNFGVPVDDDVRAEAEEFIQNRRKKSEASRSVDADVNIPNIVGDLLPYQRAGVAYAVDARRCFIADDMGLGKTVQALAALEFASQTSEVFPAVIICPPSLVLNWKKEINRWFPHRSVEVVTNRSNFPGSSAAVNSSARNYGASDYLVVGYSNISHWEQLLLGFNAYVFDESHYVKTPTAQRTKSAIKLAKSCPKTGMVLCLTGTPITNRPAEYASQLEIIGRLNSLGGKWGFYRRYCGAYQDKWKVWHTDGATNLDELNDTLRSVCYIRRTKTQVLDELPDVRHAPIVVDGTAKIMREYKEAQDDIIDYLVKRAAEIARELGKSPGSAAVRARMKAEANQHLVRLAVLRRIAARAKMDAVTEWVESRIAGGQKVVIAAHHREIVDELTNKFGGLKIQGGMDVSDVEENKRLFQEGDVTEAPCIVLSIQAAKTGHTLTAAQEVLFVELPWTPADVDQTYSRCHRLGQKGSVTATYMITEGTVDEEIYELIQAKRSIIDAATEGTELEEEASGSQIVMRLLEAGLQSKAVRTSSK